MTTGISDISSSEGRLHRFTLICKLIGSQRGLTRKKVEDLIKKRIGSPFNNKKVIQRHLIILEKIDIIENRGGIYLLSSEGKALYELTNETHRRDLSFNERAFYLRMILTSVLREQLITFLEVIREHTQEMRKEVIFHLFSTEMARNLWNASTIKRNLTRLHESGKIPTFFENKFRCMEMWLEDLGLVVREKNKLSLTEEGRIVLDEIGKIDNIKYEVYGLTGCILIGNVTPFRYDKHRKVFLKMLREAYPRFKTELSASDIRALKTFTCINLLKKKITLEEDEFDEVVKNLKLEGVVRSVMLGRDGKPAYISLSEVT